MSDVTLRAFIAIELDDALRAELKHIQRELQAERASKWIRWVAPQNIHLTLKFLGNLPAAQLAELTQALVRAAHPVAPFELAARGLGCFPNVRRPNNLWVGLDGEVKRAHALARRIEEECAAVGIARDARGFAPHLTLGRVKRDAPNHERAAIGELVKRVPDTTLGEIHAHALFLIQSELRPTGPVYAILHQVSLNE